MHHNWSNSFLFVNATKIYQLCLGNISGDFSANNMKENETGLNGFVYDLSADYRAFDTSNIIDIHKCLTKKNMV